MKKLKHILLGLTLLLVLSPELKAQVIGLQEVAAAGTLELNECGLGDTLALEIYNCCSSDTLKSVSISDTLPTGVLFESVVSHPLISSVNTSNPSAPLFILNNLAPLQKDTIYIVVSAECGAKAAATTAYCKYFASWTDGGTAHTQDEDGNNFYAGIKSPNLQLLANGTVDFTSAGVGDTLCRSWKIQNSGIGSVLDSFRYRLRLQNGLSLISLKVNGTIVTPTQSGSVYSYDIEANLRNVGVYSSDYIIIEECFEVVGCLDNSTNSNINAIWGCHGNSCQSKRRIAIVRLSSAIPRITTKTTYKDGCYGGYDTLEVRMINTGGYRATDLTIDVVNSYSNYTTDRNRTGNYLDTSSFEYCLPGGSPVSISPSNVLLSRYSLSFFPINKHPYRAYATLPNLEPGDTIYFKALIYRACLDESSCGSHHHMATNYNVEWTKECVTGANYTLPARIVANHEGKRGGAEIDGPTDLSNGDTATFKFCFTGISSNSFDKDNNNGFLHLKYTMPQGLVWTGNLADLDLGNGTYSMPVDSVRLDTATNVLHLYYNYTNWIARSSRRYYCINPKFYLDCSNPLASTGSTNIKVESFDNFKPNCATNCEIPFTCPSIFTYNNHCPSPCDRGGFNPKISFIERINFGSPDNDEDGFPDASGSLDMDEVEWDRVVARDTFQLTYAGEVIRGINSPAAFTYGYGTSSFPSIGNRVEHHATTVEIYDATTSTYFTVSNVPVSFATSGTTRVFSFNFSPSSSATGYPTGYVFDDGDSIFVRARFVFNPTVARTKDLVNVVENLYYLSDISNPTHDTSKYRCDRWNAKLKTTDAYFTVWAPESDVVTGCNQYVARYRSYLSIGECCGNYSNSGFFKKEYRSYAVTDSMRIHIPEGYQIDSARVLFQHGTKVGSTQNIYRYGVPVHRYNGDTAVFHIGDLYDIGSGTVIPSRGGYVQYLYVHYTPTCETPANVNLPRKYDIFMKGINTWEGYTRQWLNYGTGNTKYVSPVVSIKNQGSVVSDGANRVISWEVKLQNDAASAVAKRAWLSFARPGGAIAVDSVLDISADTLLNESGGVFHAGAVNGGGAPSSRSFRVFAVFNSCISDSIMAYGGYDCVDYPTTLSTNVCNIDSTILIVNPVSAVLNIDTIQAISSSVDMCEQLEFVMSVSQRDLAAAYDNFLNVTLPVGLSVIDDSSYVMFMGDSTKTYLNPTSINAKTVQFDVSGNAILAGANEISEFADAPDNEYQVRMKLQTDCDFESGSKIEFAAGGTAPCGAQIEEAKYVQTIKINGAPAITYQVPEINLIGDTLWGCDDTLSIGAVYHNYDTTNTSVGHKFRTTLPTGFNYVPLSTTFTRNSFTTTEPTITYTFGQQVLTWASAGSTPALDSSVWSFDVSSGNSGCGELVVVADITEDFQATCVADGAICSSTSIVNSADGTIVTAKADIVFSQSEIRVRKDTMNLTIPDSLIVNIGLTNVGNYNPGNIQVEVYNDVNGDGEIDAGDNLELDTTILNINPGSNSSHQFDLSGPNGTLSCDVILRVVPECACTDTVISLPGCNVARLPVALKSFNALKIDDNTARLVWETSQEVNSDYFIIERRHESETEFTEVARVKGNGTSNTTNRYAEFDDIAELASGNIYYTLTSVDFSGEHHYFTPRVINKQLVESKVYPNPAVDYVDVESNVDESTIELANMFGQVLQTVETSNGRTRINLHDLRQGMYLINIKKNNTVLKQEKIIVIN